LELQEDWVYREEYKEAEERLEGLAWVTQQTEGGKDKTKETREENPSTYKVCPNDKDGEGSTGI